MTVKLEFDSILNKIGQCGKYQIILYIFLGIVGIPTGWQNLVMVFIGGKQDHWCYVPELGNFSQDYQRNVSTPVFSSNEYEKRCMYYNRNYSRFVNWYSSGSEVMNPSWDVVINGSDGEYGANDTLAKCNSWVYDTSEYTSTIGSQWDLVCDNDYMASLATSIYMAGFLTGAVIFGAVSDIIGRKKTLLGCILLEILGGVSAAVASKYGHYAFFVILRFIVGNAAAGSFTVSFVIVMEIIGPKYRMYYGIFVQGWFAIGFLSISGIAYFIRDHFTLQLTLALPVVFLLSYWWIIPESPRWLYAENRPLEAEAIVRKMAKWNSKTFPKEIERVPEVKDSHGQHEEERATLLDILKRPRMRTRILITYFIWFVNSLVYYGIAYNADSIGGSVYVNSAIGAAVEIPAYIVACFVLDRFGRRWIMLIMMVVGGVSLCACIPVMQNPELQWLLLVLANLGKGGISASFAIIYVFSAELFPTVVRNVAVGSGSMHARIGGILAPQIVRLDKIVWFGFPALFMGVLSIVAGLMSLLLPETAGQRLPENLQDGEDFGTKKYKETYSSLKLVETSSALLEGATQNSMENGTRNGYIPTDDENETFDDPPKFDLTLE